MRSLEMRKHLPAITMFVLPMIVVKLAASLVGATAPQSAAAEATGSAEAAPPPPTPAAPIKWSPKQIAVAHYVQSVRLQPIGPTPFLYEKADAEPAVQPEIPEIAEDPQDGSLAATPKFTLNAVMSAAGGRRALINGKPCREGDAIADTTWIVDSIEPKERSVTLRDTQSDRFLTIVVEIPQ